MVENQKAGLKMGAIRWLSTVIALAILAIGLAACGPSAGPFGEYYVSIDGSDSEGDGSEARPWRTVQFALDNVVYDGETPPRINLAKGLYMEDLVITRSVVIKGVGVAAAEAMLGRRYLPTEDVSALWTVRTPGAVQGHIIRGDIGVEFQNLVFKYGSVEVEEASVLFEAVEFQDVRKPYALTITNSPLTRVLNSRILSDPSFVSDIAVRVDQSTVVIDSTELGNTFDHVVDIRLDSVVTIQDSTIFGSKVWYADGIRLSGPSEVNILGNRIIRDHPDAEAADFGPAHGPPYAAISVAGPAVGRSDLLKIQGNVMQGFDVGIGIGSGGNRVLIQDNTINALSYPITSAFDSRYLSAPPQVDLGGGPLGSSGGNLIDAAGDFGFYHQAPWDAMACDNEWGVPVSQIPDRIYDREDDPSLGKVYWDDCTLPREIEEPAQEVGGDESSSSTGPLVEVTATPTKAAPTVPLVTVDTLCWRGPGALYEVVSSLVAGTEVQILGRGVEGDWWVIDNPRYPGVRCWAPGDDIEVKPNFSYPDTLFEIPPLPTATPQPGCLWYDQQQNEACFPLDSCPVDFENSLGACTP